MRKKNTRSDWLINYIPEPIRKIVGAFKDRVVSHFKANTSDFGKQTMYWRGKKLSKPKAQKQSEDNIIKSIRNLFILKKENKETKDRIIRDIRTLFEQKMIIMNR